MDPSTPMIRARLIGRDAELTRLREAVVAGGMAVVVGLRGTGKTRLVDEMIASLPAGTRVVRGRAEDGLPGSALGSLLRDRLAGRPLEEVARETWPQARTDELAVFLGHFLGKPIGGGPFLDLFADDGPRREVAGLALRRFLTADAAAGPMVLVLDDLHLADDDSLATIEELASAPVAIVAIARMALQARRPGFGAGATRVVVGDLQAGAAGELLRELLRPVEKVPQRLVDDAIAMTDGNPFLLGELCRRWIAEDCLDVSSRPWKLDAARAGEVELPVSVDQAVEARIAALSARELDLLEKAAIFGMVFWQSGLVAMTRAESGAKTAGWADDGVGAEVAACIDGLAERDYVLRLPAEDSSVPGDVEVVFKHNLERDLVSGLTDPPRQMRLSRVAAQWMEIKLAERSGEQLEFLSQLYERGGNRRRAALAVLAAADKARDRYANQNAIDLYWRALALLEPDDVGPRLEALHNLGTVLVLVGRGDEATGCFEEMLRLAWLYDHPAKAGAAHGRIGRLHRARGEYDQALARFARARELFERAGDRRGVAGTLDDAGIVQWLRGVYATALEQHEQALAIRRTIGDARSVALSLANIGRVHHDLGAFRTAIERFREAIELRRSAGDRAGVVSSMVDLAAVHQADGAFDAAGELLTSALKLAREIGDRQGQAQALGRRGEVLLAQGRGPQAIESLEKAKEIVAQLGDRAGQSDSERRLAEAHLAAGEKTAAIEHARRALELAEAIGSRVGAGVALRVLAGASDGEAAGELFRRAIETLRDVQNDLELARVYRAFASYRERSGNAAEAATLRARADEIFARLRGAATGQPS